MYRSPQLRSVVCQQRADVRQPLSYPSRALSTRQRSGGRQSRAVSTQVTTDGPSGCRRRRTDDYGRSRDRSGHRADRRVHGAGSGSERLSWRGVRQRRGVYALGIDIRFPRSVMTSAAVYQYMNTHARTHARMHARTQTVTHSRTESHTHTHTHICTA